MGHLSLRQNCDHLCLLRCALAVKHLALGKIAVTLETYAFCERHSVFVSLGDTSLGWDNGRVGPIVERWETDPADYRGNNGQKLANEIVGEVDVMDDGSSQPQLDAKHL